MSQAVASSRWWSNRDPFRLTAWALMANTVTTSALGVLFWAQASRRYSTRDLGEDAALLSATMLLSTVSQLNLSVGIPRLLPQVRERRWRPVLGAYGVTAVVGACATACFVVIAPTVSDEFAFLGDNLALAGSLVAAVVLWNVFALQDAVLTSAGWAVAVPIENAAFGVVKIGLLIWLAERMVSGGIFHAWLLAMALLLVPVNALLFGTVLRRRPRGHAQASSVLPLENRPRIARYLATDYVAALLSQGYSALLPLIVIGVLGRAANAYFYVSFLIVVAVGALAQSLSVSLVVEGAHDESSLVRFARRSIRRYCFVVLPATVVAIGAAPLVLGFFGSDYASRATPLLRLLLLGTIPQALVTLYLGVERVRAEVRRVLAVEALTLVLVTGGAVVGMHVYGLIGVGISWLVAQSAVAILVAPRVWRLCHVPRVLVGKATRRRWAAADLSAVAMVDVGAAVITVLLLLMVGSGVTGPPTLLVTLAFLTFVPGWATLTQVAIPDIAARVALAVALSLAMTSAGALAMVWLDLWQPGVLLASLAVLSLIGTGEDLRRQAAGPHRTPALVVDQGGLAGAEG